MIAVVMMVSGLRVIWRMVLAGKRVLVVLDNARDAAQVRPLLPGSPGCLALVTSRDHLTALAAAVGARLLALDRLAAPGARDLLASRLGPGRIAGEPEAADEIIERCARLPLALSIVAALAAARPGFPLAVTAAELRQATAVLDPFQGGDVCTDIRAVFSWSYRALGPDAARLFRLLGLHPGPDMTVNAAACLAGIAGQARALLAELTRGNLLTEHRPGRYAFPACSGPTPASRRTPTMTTVPAGTRRPGSSTTACTPPMPPPRWSIRIRPGHPGRAAARCRADRTRDRRGGAELVHGRTGHAADRRPLAAEAGVPARAWQLARALESPSFSGEDCGMTRRRRAKTGLDAAAGHAAPRHADP